MYIYICRCVYVYVYDVYVLLLISSLRGRNMRIRLVSPHEFACTAQAM